MKEKVELEIKLKDGLMVSFPTLSRSLRNFWEYQGRWRGLVEAGLGAITCGVGFPMIGYGLDQLSAPILFSGVALSVTGSLMVGFGHQHHLRRFR